MSKRIEKVKLDELRVDGGVNARAEMNPEAIRDYAEVYKKAKEDGKPDEHGMPRLIAFEDEETKTKWLGGGFHRRVAAKRAGYDELEVEIKTGGKEKAILYALSDNAEHGVRRTQADKEKAVKVALSLPYFAERSSREIADHCHVAHGTVEKYRKALAREGNGDNGTPEEAKETTRTDRRGHKRKVKVGSRKKGGEAGDESEKRGAADKPGAPLFDMSEFLQSFGKIARGPDAIKKAYKGSENIEVEGGEKCPEWVNGLTYYDLCTDLADRFITAVKAWEKKAKQKVKDDEKAEKEAAAAK